MSARQLANWQMNSIPLGTNDYFGQFSFVGRKSILHFVGVAVRLIHTSSLIRRVFVVFHEGPSEAAPNRRYKRLELWRWFSCWRTLLLPWRCGRNCCVCTLFCQSYSKNRLIQVEIGAVWCAGIIRRAHQVHQCDGFDFCGRNVVVQSRSSRSETWRVEDRDW